MNHEVENYVGELQELRAEVVTLRARVAACTCGAATSAPAYTRDEQQLDLVDHIRRAGCED